MAERAAEGDRADLTGGAYVGTAARAAIDVGDGHDAQHALSWWRFAKTGRGGRVLEAHAHRPILEHDLVRPPFGLA